MKKFITKFEKSYPKLSEMIRFLIVGGVSTFIDFLVMSLVIYLPNRKAFQYEYLRVFIDKDSASVFYVVLGTAVGFIVGLIFNYIFSLLFVYKAYDKKAKEIKGFMLFLLFSLIGLIMQTLGVFVGYGLLNIHEWVVKAFFVIVVLIFNYYTRKRFIFNKEKNKENVDERIL